MTRVPPEELLASFSWFRRWRLRRSPRRLDLEARAMFLVQWAGFFVLLGLSLLVLLEHGPPLAAEHPVLVSITVLVAVGKHALGLLDLFGGEVLPFAKVPAKERGRLAPREVEALVGSMGERFGSRRRPNVYVATDKEANALTTSSLLLGFVPRFDAVVLNSYLCRALRPDELRAILAHELAHFYRYIGPLGRNAWLGMVGSVAACVAFYAADPEILDTTLLALAVVWWAPLPFLWLFAKIANLGFRDLEFACDAFAAGTIGAESMINALLKMGDRQEVLELVQLELGRHLEEHPQADPDAIGRALFGRVPEGPVTVEEARRALQAAPVPKSTGGGAGKAGKLLIGIRSSQDLRKALKVVPWSDFDTVRRDGRLDGAELDAFVRALASDSLAATNELSLNHPAMDRYLTHPSTRQRILYLYLHFLAAADD